MTGIFLAAITPTGPNQLVSGFCKSALPGTRTPATQRPKDQMAVTFPDGLILVGANAALRRAPPQDPALLRDGGHTLGHHLAPLPKLLLALPSKVPHQPVGVEGVLGRHAPAHDGVQEGLPLSGVEAQHLGGRRAGV